MIFVVSQTGINLRSGQIGKAGWQRFHGFTVVEQPNHIMDTDARPFDHDLATANPRIADDMAIPGVFRGRMRRTHLISTVLRECYAMIADKQLGQAGFAVIDWTSPSWKRVTMRSPATIPAALRRTTPDANCVMV